MTGEVRSVLAMFMLIVVATGSVVALGVRLAVIVKARCVIVVPAG